MRWRFEDRMPSKLLFRVVFKYAQLAAALLVVSALVLAVIGAPPWLLRSIGLTLFLAFPFVLVLAWALSAEPLEGARRKPWDPILERDAERGRRLRSRSR